VSVHLIIGGSSPEQCSVVIEPYGAEYVLMGDDHLRLDIDVSDDSAVEVGYSPGCITLWLPVSVVSVRAANRIGDELDLGLDAWHDSSSP
jgi:hypothetical protein